jgi:hypothetical protein
MVELHRHAVAEVDLLAGRAAEMAHAANFLEVSDGHACGPPVGDFDADVGFFNSEDGGVDYGLDAAGVMDGRTLDLQKAAMRRGDELPDIEDDRGCHAQGVLV